jgi:hypothetical protein
MNAENFAVLEPDQHKRGYRLYDLGPGLEYSFLFFNLNDLDAKALEPVARKQSWFRQAAFRKPCPRPSTATPSCVSPSRGGRVPFGPTSARATGSG